VAIAQAAIRYSSTSAVIPGHRKAITPAAIPATPSTISHPRRSRTRLPPTSSAASASSPSTSA
jgi:hypothetical protein